MHPLSILRIVNKRISLYCQNINLLPPKPKTSLRHLILVIQKFHRKYVLAPADKAAKMSSLFKGSIMLIFLSKNLCGTKAYELQGLNEESSVVNDHTYHSATEFAVSVKEGQDKLQSLYGCLHKRPYKAWWYCKFKLLYHY